MTFRLQTVFAFVALLTGVGPDQAQERASDISEPAATLEAEVKLAVRMAKLKPDDHLASRFGQIAVGQKDEFNRIHKATTKDERVDRLARYLSAKAAAKGDVTGTLYVGPSDLGDFHWAYLERDITYSPTRFVDSSATLKVLRLKSIEVPGIRYEFGATGLAIESGQAFVLPRVAGQEYGKVTATFEGAGVHALWTGSTSATTVTVAAPTTSQGGEIHVNSSPPGAEVYFNGRRWHRLTNTKSVHDPGTYEVVIRLAGHREWRTKQAVAAGQSWTIDARLEREK
ncbi:MAG: PEGA domain-containing protein [Burkholderiaceae bacterium]|nr:PEGA domain-containing protein [Burkholderiaceae bacterium]